MCGRYTLYSHEDELASLFAAEPVPVTARYNIAPTQEVLALRARPNGEREFSYMRWGLIPHWVNSLNEFKVVLFNARSETAAEKPSFRDAMRSTRCILPASGFYEWRAEGAPRGGVKQPYYFSRGDGRPLALAGLYSVWARGGSALMSCTILTAEAAGPLREYHHRVPVILEEPDWQRWLTPEARGAQAFTDLLQGPPEGTLTWHPVSRRVGNARDDSPELLAPVTVPEPGSAS